MERNKEGGDVQVMAMDESSRRSRLWCAGKLHGRVLWPWWSSDSSTESAVQPQIQPYRSAHAVQLVGHRCYQPKPHRYLVGSQGHY
jgi:hypothetical protein